MGCTVGCVGYHDQEKLMIPLLNNMRVYCNRTTKKGMFKLFLVIDRMDEEKEESFCCQSGDL